MIPVVTPTEMAAIDAAAPEPVEQLIQRAGSEVARVALRMLGGTYGRVVNVIVGKGNNGADGSVAAMLLERRRVRVRRFDAQAVPSKLPSSDLVIDAAYGTGFRGAWVAPDVGSTPVLAVDVPSGVNALTGEVAGAALAAAQTITFQALKPGLLFGEGAALSGTVEVADIGLDVSRSTQSLVELRDVAAWWPVRPADANKWRTGVKVLAGSKEMPGAAILASLAAARAGASLVSLSSPGAAVVAPPEIVYGRIAREGFAPEILLEMDRFKALVMGPGLGRDKTVMDGVRECIAGVERPVVIDGDALFALAAAPSGAAALLAKRTHPTVLTPHDGEFELLTGERPGIDRVAAARSAADRLACTVLLKGPTTVVASPSPDGAASAGDVFVIGNGDQRLATAGTGDVLAGMVAASLASGTDPGHAAAASAWFHAEAANRRPAHGLIASDLRFAALPELLSDVIG